MAGKSILMYIIENLKVIHKSYCEKDGLENQNIPKKSFWGIRCRNHKGLVDLTLKNYQIKT